MAPEAASEGYYMTSCCGEASGVRGSYSPTSSPDPNVFYHHHHHHGHEDTRARKEAHCGGSQYPSWPQSFASYPSNEAKMAYAPSPYSMPAPHGVAPLPMPVHMPTIPAYGAAGQMVTPQPPMFGVPSSRTSRSRAEGATATESSSSNCTPRDHYTNAGMTSPERHYSPQKRYSRKHDAAPRLPVVKIPESLKKFGHPCPATWFNSRGFPLRMGKPDCKHYTTKGWCAYGTLCKFNHPEGLQTPGMSYAMMPCCPGSPPPMVSAPWMGLHYQWGGAWSQQPQSMPMQPGYQPYMCHPCMAGPCSEESGFSSRTANGGDNEKATDAESDALYNN